MLVPLAHIYTKRREREGERERQREREKERDSHITPNTPFIDVALGAVMAAECENDTNTHREGGRERDTKHREREGETHTQNTERGRDREALRRTNPLPPPLNPPHTLSHLIW